MKAPLHGHPLGRHPQRKQGVTDLDRQRLTDEVIAVIFITFT